MLAATPLATACSADTISFAAPDYDPEAGTVRVPVAMSNGSVSTTIDYFVSLEAPEAPSFAEAVYGYPLPAELKVGAMLEVPSLLFQLKEICAVADFLSIGSNDLMQFLFAVDRENRRVADRFDPLSGAMLRALQRVVEKAEGTDCGLTVCGEIGGEHGTAVGRRVVLHLSRKLAAVERFALRRRDLLERRRMLGKSEALPRRRCPAAWQERLGEAWLGC